MGSEHFKTDLEVGPEDLLATEHFVKTLSNPFEYKVVGRIQKATAQ